MVSVCPEVSCTKTWQNLLCVTFWQYCNDPAVEVIETIWAVEATEVIEAVEALRPGKSLLRTLESSRHLNSAFFCFGKTIFGVES